MKVASSRKNAFWDNKRIYYYMIFLAICLSIKYIFVDFGIDAEYQIVMAYRLVKGDIMFKEMWEAHQTSAFLCALFIKIYLSIFKTTTGLVLYLQLMGVLTDALVSFLLYKVVNKYLESKGVAFAMAWVFFVVSPKDVPIAEFANMQIWCCMLLCISMFMHYETKKKRYLILAALSLCAMVLSYPSCLIVVVGVGILFLWKGELRQFLLFLSVCMAVGLAYLLFILTKMSPAELVYSLENMLAIEPTHTTGMGTKFIAYAKDAAKIGAFFIIAYGAAYIIALVTCRLNKQGKENRRLLTDLVFYMSVLAVSLYVVIRWQFYIRYCYSLVFIAVIIVGLRYFKFLSGSKLYLYVSGTILSLLGFLATLILTDLEFMASVPYLLIAVTVAFLPIAEAYRGVDTQKLFKQLMRAAVVCGALVLTLRNVYIIRPMSGLKHNMPITAVRGVVKEGPAVGMFSEYMGPYIQNESIKEWRQYIEEGSTIYLIGGALDTLGYLYLDTNVGAPSVMSTPGYNECIAEYWEMNPHKYPDVIIASCWYGELNQDLQRNDWINTWIEEEYRPQYQIDGKYWRYYFRNE